MKSRLADNVTELESTVGVSPHLADCFVAWHGVRYPVCFSSVMIAKDKMVTVGSLVAIVVLSLTIVAMAIAWGITGSQQSSCPDQVSRGVQGRSVKDHIWHVARAQVLLANVKRPSEEPRSGLYWFRLGQQSGSWSVQATSRKSSRDSGGFHRLSTVCEYLSAHVLPQLNDVPTGLEGYYVVETNDGGVSTHPDYTTFCYSQRATTHGSLTMPDLYNMMGHPDIKEGRLEDNNVCESLPWAQRKPKIVFVGSDTGPADLVTNRRVLYCRWGNTKPDLAHCKITRLSQFPRGAIPPDLQGPEMSVTEQLQYRYILSVDGNAASWGRVPATLKGCSILFKDTVPNQEQLWYYPFMVPDVHYVEVNLDTIEQQFHRVEADKELQAILQREGKRFVDEYMSDSATAWWTEALFRNIAHQRRGIGL